ncbi:7-cyano-7-deazaguanine synthase [Cronobacter sakazakii]|nr:7-cyano-7-deazaguanine synthase [Cronobacter sakazakii]
MSIPDSSIATTPKKLTVQLHMNNLDELTSTIGPVRFHSPFRYSSKADVARVAAELGVPIGRTYSCQASAQFPCGACPNCVERLSALKEAKLV